MKTLVLFTSIFFISSCCAVAGIKNDSLDSRRDKALKIFLDCSQCDLEYFRTNFTSVNYVNDSFETDVHILVTALPTGGGGVEYSIRLVGKNEYETMDYSFSVFTPDYFTFEETRTALLEKIRLGLVPYLLQTPYSEKLSLQIEETPAPVEEIDPWKNWVFDISASGSLARQKYFESYSVNGSIYASKINREIKIESSSNYGLADSKYSFTEGDTLTSYHINQQDIYSQNLVVKSLGNHWGIGGFTSLGRSRYANTEFQVVTGPAAEYNLFSYDEAATRECRFLYAISYEYSNYYDLTAYGKLVDNLFRQDLNINFSYYEPWGTLSAIAMASSYLDYPEDYSIGATAIAFVRIFRGLAVNISASAGYSNNQRSLRQEQGTGIEYLTGQWEMEQGLSYSINFGISYRFGSKNNNAVNPRFGH